MACKWVHLFSGIVHPDGTILGGYGQIDTLILYLKYEMIDVLLMYMV